MAGGFIELALRLQRPRKEKKGQREKKRSKNEQKNEEGEKERLSSSLGATHLYF